jgi:hypothetical protein
MMPARPASKGWGGGGSRGAGRVVEEGGAGGKAAAGARAAASARRGGWGFIVREQRRRPPALTLAAATAARRGRQTRAELLVAQRQVARRLAALAARAGAEAGRALAAEGLGRVVEPPVLGEPPAKAGRGRRAGGGFGGARGVWRARAHPPTVARPPGPAATPETPETPVTAPLPAPVHPEVVRARVVRAAVEPPPPAAAEVERRRAVVWQRPGAVEAAGQVHARAALALAGVLGHRHAAHEALVDRGARLLAARLRGRGWRAVAARSVAERGGARQARACRRKRGCPQSLLPPSPAASPPLPAPRPPWTRLVGDPHESAAAVAGVPPERVDAARAALVLVDAGEGRRAIGAAAGPAASAEVPSLPAIPRPGSSAPTR